MNVAPQQLDTLTGEFGLLNRVAFVQQFQEVLGKATTKGEPLTLALLDIDHFYEVNRDHGHTAGDLVLLGVAGAIREAGGPDLIAGRYGGDEFGILLPNIEREQAFLLLEGIRTAITRRESFGNGKGAIQVQVAISGGIATYPIDGRTEDELLRSAEQALYRAKQSGRNKIRLAFEEKMIPKTTHFTQTQLERLAKLASEEGVSEAVLLREALDNLLRKYMVTTIES